MENDRYDPVFLSLAHIARRQMLDLLIESPGLSVNDMASHFDMSRIAVMKHLRMLEEAELLISKRKGRTRHLYFNPVPIQMIYDRWTTKYSAFWAGRMADIKARVEAQAEDPADTEEPKSA